MSRFDYHTHTGKGSNIRLIDSICTIEGIINRAIELELSGIAITDHEALCSHPDALKYFDTIKEKYPNFKLCLGNEIYLVDERPCDDHYHYILLAKDKEGHKQLRILSSLAWLNSSHRKGLERVDTLKSDLERIIKSNPGHLIGSTACFRAGQQVLTKNGYKNIENIVSGDFVKNYLGEWEEVLEPTSREYIGTGKEITYQGGFDPIFCTDNHQFLVSSNNYARYSKTKTSILKWVPASELKTSKYYGVKPLNTQYNNNIYIEKKSYQYCLFTKNNRKYSTKEIITITPEIMRLFGLWLGDGSVDTGINNRICFTFNDNEFDIYYDSFVKKALEDIGGKWNISKRPEQHKVEIVSSCLDVYELFYSIFNFTHAEDKYFPERLIHISKEYDEELLFGYLLADGYFRERIKDGYKYGETVVATISKKLAKGYVDLCNDIGIPVSVTISEEKTDKNNVHHQQAYYLSISALPLGATKKLIEYSHNEVVNIYEETIKHFSPKRIIDKNGKEYLKIFFSEIKDITLNENVYCLNNTTHSFLCENMIVHNCIGGELGKRILSMTSAEKVGDKDLAAAEHDAIVKFMLWNKELFGEDFYIETQPGVSREQIIVNQRLVSFAQCFDVKVTCTSDAHYLSKEDRFIHKSFLNSKEGEREVDAFYQDAYLHSDEEMIEKFKLSGFDELFVNKMFENTIEIANKIENYSLFHPQQIPMVEVKDYPKLKMIDYCPYRPNKCEYNRSVDLWHNFPILCSMLSSYDKIERYWVNECLNKLDEIGKYNNLYLSRLEEEARVKKIIGEKLGTNIFAYPVTLQYYINRFWELGSTVGAGRGSSCSGLNHYLLGVTQLDPIEWNLPFWRYLNEDRAELPDIDLDLAPSRRPIIINDIKRERGKNFYEGIEDVFRAELGCTLVATFGTESSKSAILTACRGYRTEEYPDGIDNDVAQFLSSLVPVERGFVWSISEVYYGNQDKDRKPVASFKAEVDKYPGLLDIMLGIEGLVSRRGSHASGVIFNDEDPFEFNAYMRTPSGDVITQYDLHDAEWCGATKYDFLVTEIQDKITQAIKFLQADEKIEKDLTLKEVYNKYLHPSVLPIEDEDVWKAIKNVQVLDLFQFDSTVGAQAAKKIQPNSMLELSDANGLMRLMTGGDGQEQPIDKYVRFKNNIMLWYQEMDNYGLTKEEQEVLKPHFLKSHGVPPSQEQLMTMLMDECICGFSLKEANAARKIVGKKQMSKIPELHQQIIDQAKSPALAKYVWDCGVGPQMG